MIDFSLPLDNGWTTEAHEAMHESACSFDDAFARITLPYLHAGELQSLLDRKCKRLTAW